MLSLSTFVSCYVLFCFLECAPTGCHGCFVLFSGLGFYQLLICLIFRYIFTKQITIIKNHLTLLTCFQKSQISLETNQIFQGPTQMTTCGTQYMENISPSLDIGTRTCLDCCLQDRGNKWGGGNVMTI